MSCSACSRLMTSRIKTGESTGTVMVSRLYSGVRV